MKKLKKKIDGLNEEDRFMAVTMLIQYGIVILFLVAIYLLHR